MNSDLHVVLVASFSAVLVTAVTLAVFITTFATKPEIGVCEHYGWRLEGSGPYQHKHCYDPKTGTMYLPKEILP